VSAARNAGGVVAALGIAGSLAVNVMQYLRDEAAAERAHEIAMEHEERVEADRARENAYILKWAECEAEH